MTRVEVGEEGLIEKRFNRDFNIGYTCKTVAILIIENISDSEKFKKPEMMLQ